MTQPQQTRQHLPIAEEALPPTKQRAHRPGRRRLSRTLGVSFEDAHARVTQALRGVGLKVLTEVDVQATLNRGLAIKSHPYSILSAWDPSLSPRVLEVDDRAGTILLSSITVQEVGEEQIQVATIDPTASPEVIGNPALATIARQLRKRLWAVIRTL